MKVIISAVLLFFTISSLAGAEDSTATDDTSKVKIFEFSFGSSQLFISPEQESELRDSNAIILPTSAMLFFAEFRPFKRIRLPLFFSLPTESKQFLVDSILVNERANPTFGAGVQVEVVKFNIDKKTTIELEVGPLFSFLMTKEDALVFAPLAAGRIRIIKKKDFVMYIGSSYSFGIDSWGLFYGTGFLF